MWFTMEYYQLHKILQDNKALAENKMKVNLQVINPIQS